MQQNNDIIFYTCNKNDSHKSHRYVLSYIFLCFNIFPNVKKFKIIEYNVFAANDL